MMAKRHLVQAIEFKKALDSDHREPFFKIGIIFTAYVSQPFEFSLNANKKLLKPATSCVRNQDGYLRAQKTKVTGKKL